MTEIHPNFKAKPQKFWEHRLFGDYAISEPDDHLEDIRVIFIERLFRRLSRLVKLILVVFLLWYSTVWFNEEFLLVCSFSLLYIKGYVPLRTAFENYVYPRLVSEQVWSRLVKRTERLFVRLRFHLIVTYFTSIGTASFVRTNLFRNLELLNLYNTILKLNKVELYNSKLIQLSNFDKSYCHFVRTQEIQNVLITSITFPVLSFRV